MKPNTLFRWFVNKLTFIAVILVLSSSWWFATIKYENQFSRIKAELLTAAMEANNTENLKSLSIQKINYSIIDKDGVIVSDKIFGSMANVLISENFKQAITGKALVELSSDDSGKSIEYWGLIKYKNEPHVIVVRKEIPKSMTMYFFSYLVIFSIIAFLTLLITGAIISNPIQGAATYLNADLKDVLSEKFEKKQTSIDTIEFAELYETYNKMSDFVEFELNTLRSDLNQWEVFFSTMPRGLIAIDDQRIIHNCNANSLQLLDVKDKKASKATGLSIMAVFRNADMNRITSDFLEADKFLKEYEFELVANNIIETIKVVCVQLELPGDEATKGAIVIIENITALRRLENMRKDFVSNVSHELKTPISIIAGFVETIKECKDDPESTFRFIDIIEKNAARLSIIIDDLLNLSKLEQNEAMIRKDFEKRNISDTVKMVVDVCSHEARKKDIELVVELEESKYYGAETMIANHRLLEQALRNLIENAIRYSPKDTKVSISSRKIKNMFEISVEDSGPGISAEHQDKIFGRFYRVDKSRDRQTGGSGLGLAIVKHIARIHNGHVKLESKLGEGSKFTLVLPYITSFKDTHH